MATVSDPIKPDNDLYDTLLAIYNDNLSATVNYNGIVYLVHKPEGVVWFYAVTPPGRHAIRSSGDRRSGTDDYYSLAGDEAEDF